MIGTSFRASLSKLRRLDHGLIGTIIKLWLECQVIEIVMLLICDLSVQHLIVASAINVWSKCRPESKSSTKVHCHIQNVLSEDVRLTLPPYMLSRQLLTKKKQHLLSKFEDAFIVNPLLQATWEETSTKY